MHRGDDADSAFMELWRDIHRIKGRGGTFGFPSITHIAHMLEDYIETLSEIDAAAQTDTHALRHEVTHVPAPAGFDYENDDFIYSDSDIACYSKPEVCNHILIGSEDPECDPQLWVGPDKYELGFPDQWTAQVSRMAQRLEGLGIPSQAKGLVSMYDVTLAPWISNWSTSICPSVWVSRHGIVR